MSRRNNARPPKDVYKVLCELAEHGWSWEWTKKSHIKISKPGRRSFYVGGTPSDARSLHNLRASIAANDRAAQQQEASS